MRKIYILFISLLFACGATIAQPVNVDVAKATSEIVIDGVEEEAWDAVTQVDFVLNLGQEVPTVTAYWKALWNDTSIFVLINVEDDDHWPGHVAGGDSWLYDKPEIYFDVNDVLADGVGPATASSGHYQWSPGFAADGYDILHTEAGTTQAPGGQYAYVLSGESYVYEHAVRISSMSNKDAVPMDCETIIALPEKIGFDATVIDQDEGVTTARQRTIWQSGDGTEPEAWNSMDASGTITLVGDCGTGINDVKTASVSVHPNPVTDFLTINADFDKVIITNILGQEVSSMNQIKSNRLDVGTLSKGVYIIKVYKGERYIGAAKITKN
ncbi:MAG: T9SS type A sorting domain-containing protein [Bacteroidales bacterium]|nr:T9SS type A sorting domain-containing protein [Bacteroidales bacterium]